MHAKPLAIGSLALLLAACGGSLQPSGVHAFASNDAVEVSWEPSPAVSAYRVQLVDFDSGPIGEPVVVHGAHVTLSGLASGVRVEAVPGGSTTVAVTAGATGGSGAAWQLFGPDDFRDGALDVDFDSLGSSEKLGVLLVHAGGADGAQATVQIAGVADAAPSNASSTSSTGSASGAGSGSLGTEGASGADASRSTGSDASTGDSAGATDFRSAGLLAAPSIGIASASISGAAVAPRALTASRSLHDQVRAAQALETLTSSPAESVDASDHRAFCVVQGLDFSHRVRKPATRAAQSAHGDFFIDDEDASHYSQAAISSLVSAFENNVWPSDISHFGAPTDVDGNGRVIILFTHELGAHLNGGWLIGYFGNSDLINARDNSASCSGNGSNHGEIIYLNDLANGEANGWGESDLVSQIFPETLAHELQHLLNLGHRCVEHSCDSAQPTWLNEGLSKVAEDLAGYGWNGGIGRSEGAQYLARSDSALKGYDGRSLTLWEGDPIGNYQGAHSFVRFFADKLGPQVATQLSLGADVETALGRPWPRAMAEWASALMLSNDAGSPFNYSGAAWSPFHERLRPLDARTPGAASLRSDGLAAFVSGAGQGGQARITVRSSDPVWAVVVRSPAL